MVQYLVTGAAGHLGNTIVRKLFSEGKQVRALVLPGDKSAGFLEGMASLCEGDVTKKESLTPFFTLPKGDQAVVIHAAGIVSIASKFNQRVFDVNVGGTRNVLELCCETGVQKLVHVSSVHAIPEGPKGGVMSETGCFDPEKVEGLYAKTKAEATQLVLDAARSGLPACVVHPSGICGPFDYGKGHLTQLFIDYYKGALTAGVNGGYDFVDVRDVADGILSAVGRGRNGECYILSNRYFPLAELFEIFHTVTGRKRVKTVLPMWFAKGTAPLSEAYYRLRKQPPLYTAYSLYTLSGNVRFSHQKAEEELFYHTRPLEETVRDMADWLKSQGRI